MEQQKIYYNFNDLISILMKDNLNIELLFRKKERISPLEFIEFSEKYKKIENIFIRKEEKSFFMILWIININVLLKRI